MFLAEKLYLAETCSVSIYLFLIFMSYSISYFTETLLCSSKYYLIFSARICYRAGFRQSHRIGADVIRADRPPRLQRSIDGRGGAVLRCKVNDGVAAVARHVPQDQSQDCGRVYSHVHQRRWFRCKQR
jgi:hypothetical protein